MKHIQRESDKAKATAAASRLISLGYNVISSGYGNVMVNVGTDSHRIISVNHADVDAFIAQYAVAQI
jgi:hypothetical protein